MPYLVGFIEAWAQCKALHIFFRGLWFLKTALEIANRITRVSNLKKFKLTEKQLILA